MLAFLIYKFHPSAYSNISNPNPNTQIFRDLLKEATKKQLKAVHDQNVYWTRNGKQDKAAIEDAGRLAASNFSRGIWSWIDKWKDK